LPDVMRVWSRRSERDRHFKRDIRSDTERESRISSCVNTVVKWLRIAMDNLLGLKSDDMFCKEKCVNQALIDRSFEQRYA
jgi:hypothetical protein